MRKDKKEVIKKINKQELWTRAVFMEVLSQMLPANYEVSSAAVLCNYDIEVTGEGKRWRFEIKEWENGYRKSDNSTIMKSQKAFFMKSLQPHNNYYIVFNTGNTTAYIANIENVIGTFNYTQKVVEYDDDSPLKTYEMQRYTVSRVIDIKKGLDKHGYDRDTYYNKRHADN